MQINRGKQQKRKDEISSRKLEISKEYFMQRWAQQRIKTATKTTTNYDYTVEMMNRFKGLNLINRVLKN